MAVEKAREQVNRLLFKRSVRLVELGNGLYSHGRGHTRVRPQEGESPTSFGTD